MRVIIVGGGRVGKALLEALQSGNDISIVEKKAERCEELAGSTNALIIQGDGTNPSMLEEAGVGECDAFIAATADSKTNLVACELARRNKTIKRIVARITDKSDEVIFRDLGVNDVVWEVDGIVDKIIAALYHIELIEVDEDLAVVCLSTSEGDRSTGKSVGELKLPKRGLLFLGMVRNGQWILPSNTEIIEEGDRIFFLTQRKNLNNLYEQFF
jgi:trk system potassium uptake protein TrkA